MFPASSRFIFWVRLPFWYQWGILQLWMNARQTFFALLWKSFLKNTSWHKNNFIYIKQKGLYQIKVTLSLASIHNWKMVYCY